MVPHAGVNQLLLCCPRCKQPLAEPPSRRCAVCEFAVELTENGIFYDSAALLRAANSSRYRLYRALCNNGFVSYHELPEGSVSLPDRPDVAEFGAFLAHHVSDGATVLDVGCGPLPLPGYLVPLRQKRARLLGLEIYPTQFEGLRINGCAEYLPIRDGELDAVVFATSLDHVFDLELTLGEARRVLRGDGACFLWMSDRLPYWKKFLYARGAGFAVLRRLIVSTPKQIITNLRLGYRPFYTILHLFKHGRYWEYPNGTVFYCPPGAIDPFHSWFESADDVMALARRRGFSRCDVHRASNGVFLRLAA